MRFFVGVTDNNWYEHLALAQPDEVNFWRPSGKGFGVLEVGCPFIFKLHYPLNYITGGGYFVQAETLPMSLAWKVFENKNGADNYERFSALIRSKRRDGNHDPFITCIILNEPFWFPRDQWLPPPEDWKPNIVTGKTYDTTNYNGAYLWNQIQERIALLADVKSRFMFAEDEAQYGKEYLTKCRLGQGAFRILVTSAYHKRCSITGERTLPVLEAGHIKPFAKSGPNQVKNGILFRADLHILFDQGYLTITPEHKIEVSRSIKEEFENGRDYYTFHGRSLQVVPVETLNKPSETFLEWHNENVYLG
jgi:putative restriction endonuclease